jgi:hypothetical protein
MTCHQQARVLDLDNSDFLDTCQTLFDYRSLLVPGPLVPFFQALAACSAPFSWFGDICPGMPSATELDMTALRGFAILTHWMRILPSPVFLIDCLRYHAGTTFNAQNPATGSSRIYHRIFGQDPATTQTGWNLLGPSVVASIVSTTQIVENSVAYWSTRTDLLPAAFTSNVTRLSNIAQFFGFQGSDGNDSLRWLQPVFAVMQTYCSFFRGSVPLASISPVGLGASIPRMLIASRTATRDWIYPNAPPTADTSRLGRQPPAAFRTRAIHSDHTLPEVAEQYAQLTTINVDFSSISAQHGHTEINNDRIRAGPIWELTDQRQGMLIAPHHGYSQMVASHYHSSVSLPIQ